MERAAATITQRAEEGDSDLRSEQRACLIEENLPESLAAFIPSITTAQSDDLILKPRLGDHEVYDRRLRSDLGLV